MADPSIPPLPSRNALKAELSRSVAIGDEHALLAEAEYALAQAEAEVTALTDKRTALTRDIAVRERKLADWKGKIPRGKLPPPTRAFERSGTVPWVCIADARGTQLTLRSQYRRAASGLGGFSHIWVLYVNSNSLEASVVRVLSLDERTGVVEMDRQLVDGDESITIADLKPYLEYCDAYRAVDGDSQDHTPESVV